MDSAVACHFSDNWSALGDQRLSARELSELLLSEEECGRTRLPHLTLAVFTPRHRTRTTHSDVAV